jgi:hypothetical protein
MAAEVDAVGAHGKGDIDAVVDQQPGTVLTSQAPQFTCQRQKLVDREVFLPELDGLHAALKRSFDDGRKSLPGRKLVTIGDQVEIEVDGKGHGKSEARGAKCEQYLNNNRLTGVIGRSKY